MTSPLADRVAAEIRAELARQRMSQGELAEKVGLSAQGLSKRLAGDMDFRVPELVRIAEVLGVPVVQFLPTSTSAGAA